jgi:glyoxylase-like metal-dependent hydrolase (beta-lactamase superfamily II)/rhodanese-related sulfurtransferase
MQIKQWEDKNLAQFSYAIFNDDEKKIILIDPARNPQQYIDFADQNNAHIIGIIETHPHADFVSSHYECYQTIGVTIYTSRLVNAFYPHQTFDEGDFLQIGNIRLYPLNTPGHSPDSISIVLEHDGKTKAVFTGDTLFIGDCGRPDLREGAGNIKATRLNLAKQMYHSLREKLMKLPGDVLVYPAHGAGTLCGKSLSEARSSTIAAEKMTNWSLQDMTEDEFVEQLLKDQPFIPAYFPYDVELNREGAPLFRQSIANVLIGKEVNDQSSAERLEKDIWIIDTRMGKDYKKGHLSHSINLMEGTKFETWLGSIIKPGEKFYLAGYDEAQVKRMIERTAVIGYETQVAEAFMLNYGEQTDPELDIQDFKQHGEEFTIVDVRNHSEVDEKKIFKNSISIPLPDLRQHLADIPTDKPIVVHCAGNYRSAAASSFIRSELNAKVPVFDLSDAINQFK